MIDSNEDTSRTPAGRPEKKADSRYGNRWPGETVIRILLWMCTMVSVLTTLGVVLILCTNALHFFSPKRVVNEFDGQVVAITNKVKQGEGSITIRSDRGRERRYEINRLHRGDGRAQIEIRVGQFVEAGELLAVDPGVSLSEFFTETEWTPQFYRPKFGILPLICGTMLVAIGSGVFAIPLGLGTAIYLSEYAKPWVRVTAKPLLELLAGIPSIVYGYLAVIFVSPIVQNVFGRDETDSALSASIVVAIMILPTIVSLSEDVLRAVPKSLRDAAYALGANKYEVTVRVVVPAASSGIMASFLLAISRAVGETMAVTMAAGMQPKLTWNPLDSVQTMTSYIVAVSDGDTPVGTMSYHAIFAVGLTLFVLTMCMNLIAQYILTRTRERYE